MTMTIFEGKVLNNSIINIEKGSFVSIIGPINSGKTRLLNEIVDEIYKQEIVSYIDEGNIYNGTIKEELYNVLSYYKVPNNESKSRIKRVLKQFNIYDYIYQEIGSLTALDLKRFLLARALIINPNVLIIDNLFAQFGKKEANDILDYLKRQCAKGMTVIFTTYNLSYCLMTDKVAVINDNDIVFFKKPLEVFKNEKIINSIGLKLPFIVDLSLQLESYELVNKIVLDVDRMIDYIWK